eukprot:gene12237-15374_t
MQSSSLKASSDGLQQLAKSKTQEEPKGYASSKTTSINQKRLGYKPVLWRASSDGHQQPAKSETQEEPKGSVSSANTETKEEHQGYVSSETTRINRNRLGYIPVLRVQNGVRNAVFVPEGFK